jgi:DNA-binding protein
MLLDESIQSRVNAAISLFARGANAPAKKPYRILYLVGENCGEKHSYANLFSVDALPNVEVQYVNSGTRDSVFIDKNGRRAPGRPISRDEDNTSLLKSDFDTSFYYRKNADAYLASKHLSNFETSKAVLLDGHGRFIKKFDSTADTAKHKFIDEVQASIRQYEQNSRTQQRQSRTAG